MNDLKIIIPINDGISFRYIFQTDIFSSLQKKAEQIIVLVPDKYDVYFDSIKSYRNVIIDDYRLDECEEYFKSSKFHNLLRISRSFIQNDKFDITTAKGHHQVFINDYLAKNKRLRHKFFLFTVNSIVFLGRKLKFFRKFIQSLENFLFTPKIHTDIFKKYKPNALLVTSLGTFDYDQLFIRQAKKNNIKTISTILSWDNSTTRGYPSSDCDLIITWTETMKKELVNLSDINTSKIHVGGVAHYDKYFDNSYLHSRSELNSLLKIDFDSKLIFFATKSPNCYLSNPYVSKLISEAIKENVFEKKYQLIVRMHPIFYRRKNNKLVYSDFIDEFKSLQNEYPNLILNQPTIETGSLNYSMPEDEIKLLASILHHSSLVVNVFSTLNIEASIFDTPIVNISFEGKFDQKYNKARLNIDQDLNETHNQRIVKSGGVEMVYDSSELISSIKKELHFPSEKSAGRKKILNNEAGPFQGKAGKNIADIILNSI